LKAISDKTSHLRDINDTFFIKPLSTDLANDLNSLKLDQVNGESDQQENKVKDIIVVDEPTAEPVCPPSQLTKYFNSSSFFDHLKKHRSQQWGGASWFSFGNTMLYGEVVTSTQTMLDK
jgi:biotin--protein ligase